jgi:hypothetical protein
LGLSNGLLKGGDLGLCGWRRGAQGGGYGQRRGWKDKESEQEQQIDSTKHKIPLRKRRPGM